MECPFCKFSIPSTANVCGHCGAVAELQPNGTFSRVFSASWGFAIGLIIGIGFGPVAIFTAPAGAFYNWKRTKYEKVWFR